MHNLSVFLWGIFAFMVFLHKEPSRELSRHYHSVIQSVAEEAQDKSL